MEIAPGMSNANSSAREEEEEEEKGAERQRRSADAEDEDERMERNMMESSGCVVGSKTSAREEKGRVVYR
jgi:hypothetical protein